MSGERYYTTKIWPRLSSIGFSSAAALSTSMDPRGEPVISTWKRPCQKIQNGSEFPELVAQNFRNPHVSRSSWTRSCEPGERGECNLTDFQNTLGVQRSWKPSFQSAALEGKVAPDFW